MSALVDPRRFRALLRKEFIQIARDPSTYLIAFVLPLLLLFLFGYAVSLDTSHTRLALVVEDSSAPALSLASAFANSPQFEVTPARDVASVERLMNDGTVRAIVVIPQDFGAGAKRGRTPPVQIITDASQPNTAALAAGYGQGVVASWAASEGPSAESPRSVPAISLSPRYWYNPGLRSRFFLVPGSIAIVMAMIGTMLTALVVAREWERGTMEAMMATPISMVEFIASKVLPYFLLGLGSSAVCTLAAITVFGVPFRGSLLALTLISAAFLLPSLGMGLWISSGVKNQFVASQAALLSSFLPTMMLSGFLFEIASMPWPIRLLTYLVPARYLIPSLQTVYLAGDLWGLILPNVGVLLLFGLFFFLLSFRATRRSLD